jgi:ABC-type Mn2+/Zn2+ transport system ATPase subunit
MIRIDRAGHWFRPDRWLFRNLSFALAPSEVTAILGPNGAGKTTLLRAVCGTLPLREGAVSAEAQIGYVPQALHADQPTTQSTWSFWAEAVISVVSIHRVARTRPAHENVCMRSGCRPSLNSGTIV